jgi:hypothetical protein
MLSVVRLNVTMVNVIVLSVVASLRELLRNATNSISILRSEAKAVKLFVAAIHSVL